MLSKCKCARETRRGQRYVLFQPSVDEISICRFSGLDCWRSLLRMGSTKWQNRHSDQNGTVILSIENWTTRSLARQRLSPDEPSFAIKPQQCTQGGQMKKKKYHMLHILRVRETSLEVCSILLREGQTELVRREDLRH